MIKLFAKRPFLRNGLLSIVTFVMYVTAALGQQATYYVDPVNGNDVSNNGTSVATPFQSIEKARDVVRTVNASMTGDIYVYLRGGTYWLTSTILFSNEDSGTNGHNIIYSAYNNERPVLSGGQQITGWVLSDASRNIYAACTCASGSIQTRQLFVNGLRAVRARSTGSPSPLTFVKATGYSASGNVMCNSSIPMHQWGNQADIEFVYKNEWTAPRICASSITNNGTTTTFTMRQPGWNQVTNKGGTSVGGTYNTNGLPWYIENAYELLDAAGEWYLDKATDSLFYKPRSGENLATDTVVVSVLEELIRVEGSDSLNKAGNIHFKGITFSYSTELRAGGDLGMPDAQNNVLRDATGEHIIKAAVNLKYAKSVRFERDVFEHLGGTGLNMYTGSQDNLVLGSVFKDISGNGIQVGDYTGLYTPGTENYGQSTDTLVWLRNNDVYNSYFYKTGAEYFASTAIAASLPQDMDIVHNEIANMPYSGIHVGWGWGVIKPTIHKNTRIQYNYLHDVMLVLKDGGQIYNIGSTGGDASSKGVISNNYMLNDMNQFGALYLDEKSDWWTVTNNVVNYAPRYFMANANANVAVTNTWSTTSAYTNNGGGASVSPAVVVTNGAWPTAAQTIMTESGLENGYLNIKPLSTTAPTQVLFQNFNAETTGAAPLGWALGANGGSIQVAEIPAANNKSMKLNKTAVTAGSMAASKTFYPLTIGSLELKARAEQTNANCYIAFLGDEAGASVAAVEFKPNGKIGYLKAGAWLDTDVSYTAGTWYTIKVVFNSNTDTYDLYINGTQKLNQEPFMASGGKINKVTSGIYKDNTGTLYEDDFEVFALLSVPTQLIYQNFNAETTGNAPASWSVGANGGTVQIAEVPAATDKSMRLAKTSTSGSSMSANRTFTATTSGSVDLTVRAEQTNAYCYVAILSDAANNVLAGVTFKNNGRIAYWKSDGSWQDTNVAYTAGAWYKVKVVFNSVTDRFDLYINGVKTLDQMPSMTANGTGDIVRLGPGIYSGSIGTMYIDNVEILKD